MLAVRIDDVFVADMVPVALKARSQCGRRAVCEES